MLPLVLLLSLCSAVRTLHFETLDNEERCFTKYIKEGSTISANFQVTGVSEHNHLTRLVDTNGHDLMHRKGPKGTFSGPAE